MLLGLFQQLDGVLDYVLVRQLTHRQLVMLTKFAIGCQTPEMNGTLSFHRACFVVYYLGDADLRWSVGLPAFLCQRCWHHALTLFVSAFKSVVWAYAMDKIWQWRPRESTRNRSSTFVFSCSRLIVRRACATKIALSIHVLTQSCHTTCAVFQLLILSSPCPWLTLITPQDSTKKHFNCAHMDTCRCFILGNIVLPMCRETHFKQRKAMQVSALVQHQSGIRGDMHTQCHAVTYNLSLGLYPVCATFQNNPSDVYH